MRILVLTSSFPSERNPSASPFLADWAATLACRDYDVTVLAPSDTVASPELPGSAVAVKRFQYLPVAGWQSLAYGGGMYDNVRSRPWRAGQVPFFLGAQLVDARCLARKADVVHAHWLLPSGLVGAWVARQTGRPLVLTIHSTDLHLLRALPGGRRLAVSIIRMASALHFVAEYHRRLLFEWLGPEVDAIPSYVTPMGIADAFGDGEPPPLRREPRVGFIGRLIPIKGVDRLIRACAPLRAELDIAGAGPAHDELSALARRLGVRARFRGALSGQAKLNFIDSCDILVAPSHEYSSGRGEGLPVAVLEGLARGRVVVASDSGGTGEVIQHGHNGYLFDGRRGDELTSTLQSVMRTWSVAQRIAVEARRTGARFTASSVARFHDAAYRAARDVRRADVPA